ncbi:MULTISPECIES: hypothetical protein [Actinomycetes]|uniref:hypothetical protein n=1 Tax=Actinomycetes TaxID=1760 RepID=UPI001319E43F|nr:MULTISPECIES: hypothetical protein [Actinomycetes]
MTTDSGLGWVLGPDLEARSGATAGFGPGLVSESGVLTGFGWVPGVGSAVGVGLPVVEPGWGTAVWAGLGPGVAGDGPSTVVFGAGLGVESMPLTLVDVGGGTGFGSVEAGELGPVVGPGVRTESGEGFTPEARSVDGFGDGVTFGLSDGFGEALVAGPGVAWPEGLGAVSGLE